MAPLGPTRVRRSGAKLHFLASLSSSLSVRFAGQRRAVWLVLTRSAIKHAHDKMPQLNSISHVELVERKSRGLIFKSMEEFAWDKPHDSLKRTAWKNFFASNIMTKVLEPLGHIQFSFHYCQLEDATLEVSLLQLVAVV